MSEARLQILEVPRAGISERVPIACLTQDARKTGKPGIVWLQGFKSEMTSTKAAHLSRWCLQAGLGLTRFDYSGHGQSGGRFEDGTIGQWHDEAVTVIERLTTGPQILVGSSMGGFIALLAARRLRDNAGDGPRRIAGLVLIAPGWDMVTAIMEPRLPAEAHEAIRRDGVWLRPSRYGDGPYPITRGLIEEGRRHVLKGTGFDPGCPVRILHGMEDPDIPWRHALDLVSELGQADVRLTLIKDGDHRLSRDQDLALLTQTIGDMAGL